MELIYRASLSLMARSLLNTRVGTAMITPNDNSNAKQDDMDTPKDNSPAGQDAIENDGKISIEKGSIEQDFNTNDLEDDNQPVYDTNYEDDHSDEDYSDEEYFDEDFTPVPGVDDDFFETNQGLNEDETHALDEKTIYPKDHSDEAAVLLSQAYGVGGVIRENAHLTENIKNYRRNFFLSCLVSICLAILVAVLLAAFMSYPKTRYIPTYDNKAICEVTPENNPNITDVSIADFAKDGILNLYTFDYVNHEKQINDTLDRWYTPKGRIDTINAMAAIEILDFVKKKALTLQAGATSAAKIEQKGRTAAGEPYWIVRFPLVIDIYSGGAQPEDTQNYIATVRVVASTASAQNSKGLGIVSATLETRD